LAAHRQGGEGEFEHLVFSDGLATVSVYIEPAANQPRPTPGLSRMGTTNAWSRASDKHFVTAIGEVPPVTVRQFGNAFSLASQ
jgi:sigma-E factor negative regulatory protein RseB